jgi:hypothetical protein
MVNVEFKPLSIGIDWELQINDKDEFRILNRIQKKALIISGAIKLMIFKMDRDEFLEYVENQFFKLSDDDKESLLWIHFKLSGEIYDEIIPPNKRL